MYVGICVCMLSYVHVYHITAVWRPRDRSEHHHLHRLQHQPVDAVHGRHRVHVCRVRVL